MIPVLGKTAEEMIDMSLFLPVNQEKASKKQKNPE